MRLNRLVIIGNGFDLAHGSPTSYNQFIRWYVKNAYLKAAENETFTDSLISIKFKSFYNFDINYVESFYSNGQKQLFIPKNDFFEVRKISEIVETITSGILINDWVDLEQIYYDLLLKAVKFQKVRGDASKILKLNKELSELISQLEIYLSLLESPNIIDKITSNIYTDDKPVLSTKKELMILNFNHTNTFDLYKDEHHIYGRYKEPSVVYIHGQINSEENPMVFGFGDDVDPEYKLLEDCRDNNALSYIKTFWYLRTRNHNKLVTFIYHEDFEVLIMGHSCGLTDRTLLKMIFQNPHCKSVKIFYHVRSDGTDNYIDVAQNMSRHFDDKTYLGKLL